MNKLTGFDCFPIDTSDESIPDHGADLAEYEPESYIDSWEEGEEEDET